MRKKICPKNGLKASEKAITVCRWEWKNRTLSCHIVLWQERLLEIPLLYLSDFFKKHQDLNDDRLQGYHEENADILIIDK